MPRTIFHLDMDAFYAAIEQRDNPDLRGKPVIVGAPPSRRGVVCAASYEARKFGVRSAMPSATAGRLCPAGVFIYPRMDVYRAESHQIMDIVARTDGAIEQVSIDEAYVQLPDLPDLSAAAPIARELKAQIKAERNLTASIGVASNKFLAKLASDYKKPDGLTLIPERDKVAFLAPLPVRVIPGVGRVTEEILHRAGMHTLADLQKRFTAYEAGVNAILQNMQRLVVAKQAARGINQESEPLLADTTNLANSYESQNTGRLFTLGAAIVFGVVGLLCAGVTGC